MNTLKNFNHWISELRALAIKAKVYNEGDDKPMTQKQVNELFNKERFSEQFNNGLTPDEAFQEEMELWADAV
jgi:hypothetical protein